MNRKIHVDLALIGAGPVGMTAALVLSQAGFKLALIDQQDWRKNRQKKQDGRAFALAYTQYRLFKAIQLDTALSKHITPIENILAADACFPSPKPLLNKKTPFQIIFASEDSSTQTKQAKKSTEVLGFMIPYQKLHQNLVQAIQNASQKPKQKTTKNQAHNQPDILTFPETHIENIDKKAAHITLTLQNGQQICSKLLIGADGTQSAIRRKMAVNVYEKTYQNCALAMTIQHEKPHDNTAIQYFYPHGPIAVLPLQNQHANVIWTDHINMSDVLKTIPNTKIADVLAEKIENRLGKINIVSERHIYPLKMLLAQNYIKHRMALIGDAAHTMHPIAGQGFNLGLKDIAALENVLTEALRLGEDIGAQSVLARYEKWRRFDNARMVLFMDRFHHMFSSQNPLLKSVRRAALLSVNACTPLRRFFARQAAGKEGKQPKILQE